MNSSPRNALQLLAETISPPHREDQQELAGPALSVIIPTFNERDNITPLVERLRKALAGIDWEVIFVDDDSKDHTLEIVRQISLRDRRVRGIRRVHRRGLAGACVEGVLSSSAPIVAVMDADLQHDETCLSKMFAVMSSTPADMVIATRYGADAQPIDGFTGLRHAGSKLATTMAQRLLAVHTTDPMSGFFVARRAVIETVAPRLSQHGFKILLDILTSSQQPLEITEVHYAFRPRLHGESKLDASIVIEYLGLIIAKLSGDLITARFLMFCMVGSIGLIVHLAMLRLLLLDGFSFPIAQTLAMITAIISNYTLNNSLTYRDRRRRGWRFVSGLLLFAALSSFGVVAGVGLSTLIYNHQPYWWLDGIAGAIIGAVWNYITSSAVTWRAR
ncbi:glycosyltransferase family 2 protein [Rhizobium rhizogenes]|jgi:dolichol-phosphate mannosyltransferase|uniref:glycosyltransferase family 2 protein n=1 Tax=Rhizobium rhizogenes TaxID=359 RepID=UPI00157311A8|nr:glycosyltransferase family 2 protein [Rhizobium rhizogenes]NTG45714.1 glycosyltransferase family 2 protein [Rhizobium rhizogenes]